MGHLIHDSHIPEDFSKHLWAASLLSCTVWNDKKNHSVTWHGLAWGWRRERRHVRHPRSAFGANRQRPIGRTTFHPTGRPPRHRISFSRCCCDVGLGASTGPVSLFFDCQLRPTYSGSRYRSPAACPDNTASSLTDMLPTHLKHPTTL
jgi:hypothetical protein